MVMRVRGARGSIFDAGPRSIRVYEKVEDVSADV